ncbi:MULTISPECIES: alpha/beta hydrolase [unclassified Nostoc]|uniref:alpha/beta hydrolase n=1 Tax=unclassified Nostoc TaxID=2593658 RepID=UPI002AD1D704|nr:alpha/beta hydrolase [Nostoc sp. DedQUE03]MDZ7972451.1 alpha/beta hydrolase [Nostoc sp. DedQUE03]MDZ8044651.1 alpha/beta hydrolase [Nostoc sp. DedQUE02]
MKKFLKYLGLGLLSTFLTATPGLGAERISFYYPPFGEFSLSVDSLETFAKEGKIDQDFSFYASRATPEQLAQLRDLLQQRFNVTPTLVSQVTYSPIGEQLVQQLGKLLLTESRKNGFYAIRASLILSAADQKEGLTVVNLLRKFPSDTIRVNFTEGLRIVDDLSQLIKKKDEVFASLQKEAIAQAATDKIDFSKQPDLRSPGKFTWQKKSLELNDISRSRRLPVDIYLPKAGSQNPGDLLSPPFPLIVISHGLASDRSTFVYLAEHLASYGFAVAVLEHPGSNAERFQQYFAGLAGPPDAAEFINRPLDIKYLLNELQRLDKSDSTLQGKLNFQQVGAIGQSFGGYTVLTLAGANINFEQLRQDCNPDNSSFNLSLFLQCQATELPPKNYELKDDRIKAIIAINPIDSSVLGQGGISQIKIPVMLVAGSQDVFAPPVFEQIRPFTWLSDSNKYLALIENATHFSAIAEPTPQNNVLPVPPALLGPDRAAVFSYLNALSVAFLETHLLNRPEYRSYLQPSYATFISKEPLNLSLLQSLSVDQFNQIWSGPTPQASKPSNPQPIPTPR